MEQDFVRVQRLSLALGASEDRVVAAVEEAIATSGDSSAARQLLGGPIAPDAVAILYTNGGLSDTKRVTLLCDRTRDDHAAAVASGAELRYVVCYAPTAQDESSEAATLRSLHEFSGVRGDVQLPGMVHFTCDVRPAALGMPTRTQSEFVTRDDENTIAMREAADLVSRGIAGCDIDGAARCGAQWLSDVAATIDAEYDRLVGGLFDQLRARTAASGDGAPAPTSLALGLVEAQLRRLTTLTLLRDAADQDGGSLRTVLGAREQGGDERGTDAQQALQQRVTSLHAQVDEARNEAWSLLPLLRPLTALRLMDCGREQSLRTLAADLIDSLALGAALAVATSPRSGRRVNSAFFAQQLLPLLTVDLVSQVEAFLALPAGVFLPAEEGPTESAEVPAIDSALAPRCTAAPFQAALVDAATTLRRWAQALERACTGTTRRDFQLLAGSVRLQPDSTSNGVPPAAVGAAYAADRCDDLAALVRRIVADGCGLMPPPVATLFGTIHRAAGAFPLLSSHQYRNWGRFTDVMERSFVLRYPQVDASIDYEETVAAVAAPAPVSISASAGSGGTQSPSRWGGAAADEEKVLLRSRVVSLTAELTDCRSLLGTMEARVVVAEHATKASQAEAASLREELAQLRLRLDAATTAQREVREQSEGRHELAKDEVESVVDSVTDSRSSPPPSESA